MTIWIKRATILLLTLTTLILNLCQAAEKINIPILCYHNLNPVKPGSMNMTPQKFESQIKWILDNGYNIIPLSDAVAYLEGKKDSLPNKSVVVTFDDGWLS